MYHKIKHTALEYQTNVNNHKHTYIHQIDQE